MSSTADINLFLSGAVFMAYASVALIFWRSWHETRDRLFKWFSAAFLALALERVVLLLLATNNESIHLVYIVRLFAYALIIWAIIDKNRSPQR